MKRTDKEQLVSELSSKIRRSTTLYFTDFTGLNVKRMTELRRRLRRAGVEYVVIKNTLALRAVNESGLTGSPLSGPTGVVLSNDAVAAAKLLAEFARENDHRPAVKGGLMDGIALDETQVRQLATMASREQLLSQLGATFQAPMSGFLGAMNALFTNFSGVLESLKLQKEGT
jgi:large subunit ribosomal protein L10